MDEHNDKSIGWVAGALMLAVAAIGWVILATQYFQWGQVGGDPERDVWENAIQQIPNFFQVMGYAFRERLWIVILFAVLEAAVIGLYFVMKKIQREWDAPPKGRRR